MSHQYLVPGAELDRVLAERDVAQQKWEDAVDERDRYREALDEARAGLKEAYEYGCEWPIGLDTDPQEQRGMDRDTFIGNMEYFLAQIDAAAGGDPE